MNTTRLDNYFPPTWEARTNKPDKQLAFEADQNANTTPNGVYAYPRTIAGSLERISDDLAHAGMFGYCQRDWATSRVKQFAREMVIALQGGLSVEQLSEQIEAIQTKQECSSDVDLSHILEGK